MADLLTKSERTALLRDGMPMEDRGDPYPNPLLRALDTIDALVAMLRECKPCVDNRPRPHPTLQRDLAALLAAVDGER